VLGLSGLKEGREFGKGSEFKAGREKGGLPGPKVIGQGVP